jgi:ferric-dicitrate binding protein FerR (iron transport regulator)
MSWRTQSGSAMDALIERAWRTEATPQEIETLAAWRRESIANEQQYRRTIAMLTALRVDRSDAPPMPSMQTILERPREARPAAPARRRRSVGVVAAAAGFVALALGGYAALRARANPPGVPLSAETASGVGYSTAALEMATVQLSDGSVVRLAPNSTLRFVETATTREAVLDGRAFFSVAHNPARVFRVRTRLGDATVLGTRFELSTAAQELTLVVVSGRVGLAAGANSVEVRGGEQSGVRNGTALAPAPVPRPETMEEWVGKFLAFRDTPVREAAREIAETYGLRVVIGDSVVANRTVSGTFTDREAKHVLDAVCLAVNARCEARSGEVVITSR